MRTAIFILPLVLLGACRADVDETNDSVTLQYSENLAESALNDMGNAAEDVGNEAENLAKDVGNDVGDTAEKVENEVR